MEWETIEYDDLLEKLHKLFKLYSKENVSSLNLDEFAIFINDLRNLMFLPKLETNLMKDLTFICDSENNNEILPENIIDKTKEVFIILTNAGLKYEKYLRKTYADFDIDDSGFIETSELKLFCNLMCDNFDLKRCETWQINYIINLIDIDGNSKIDIDEFLVNYPKIHIEILKNKKLKKRKGTFVESLLNLDTQKSIQNENSSKKDLCEEVSNYIIEYMSRNAKKILLYEEPIPEENSMNLTTKDIAAEIDIINNKSKIMGKDILAIHDLVNTNEIEEGSSFQATNKKMSKTHGKKTNKLFKSKFENRFGFQGNDEVPIEKIKRTIKNSKETRNIFSEWFHTFGDDDKDCFDGYDDFMEIIGRYLKVKTGEKNKNCSKNCNDNCNFCKNFIEKNSPEVENFFYRYRNNKISELTDYVIQGSKFRDYLNNTLAKLNNFCQDTKKWIDIGIDKIYKNIDEFNDSKRKIKQCKDNEHGHQEEVSNCLLYDKNFKDQSYKNKKSYLFLQTTLNEILSTQCDSPTKKTYINQKMKITEKMRTALPLGDFQSPFYRDGISYINNEKDFQHHIKELRHQSNKVFQKSTGSLLGAIGLATEKSSPGKSLKNRGNSKTLNFISTIQPKVSTPKTNEVKFGEHSQKSISESKLESKRDIKYASTANEIGDYNGVKKNASSSNLENPMLNTSLGEENNLNVETKDIQEQILSIDNSQLKNPNKPQILNNFNTIATNSKGMTKRERPAPIKIKIDHKRFANLNEKVSMNNIVNKTLPNHDASSFSPMKRKFHHSIINGKQPAKIITQRSDNNLMDSQNYTKTSVALIIDTSGNFSRDRTNSEFFASYTPKSLRNNNGKKFQEKLKNMTMKQKSNLFSIKTNAFKSKENGDKFFSSLHENKRFKTEMDKKDDQFVNTSPKLRHIIRKMDKFETKNSDDEGSLSKFNKVGRKA